MELCRHEAAQDPAGPRRRRRRAPLRAASGRALTAAVVAAEAQKRYTFPVDLGDGWRLDSIAASGNDVVSTITMTEEAGAPPPPAARAPLEAALTSDTCREIASATATYVKHHIRIVKKLKNRDGAEWLSVTVDPATCT